MHGRDIMRLSSAKLLGKGDSSDANLTQDFEMLRKELLILMI
jgi:hypothetical protein